MKVSNMQIIPKTKILRKHVVSTFWRSGGLVWNILLIWFVAFYSVIFFYEVLCAPINDDHYIPLGELTPYRLKKIQLDNHLINYDTFRFLTDSKCKDYSFLLVLVASKPTNRYNRDKIRQTWGKRVSVVFLLGDVESSQLRHSIETEHATFKDIVQGNFIDAYRNMTYKHVMALKWVSAKCPRIKYIIKVDDDVFVNVHSVYQWLLDISPYGAMNLIACEMEPYRIVYRHESSPWKVTLEEYSESFYPEFCRGWAIIYTPDVVQRLYSQSSSEPYFWIDDVYVTGLMAKHTNIRITDISKITLNEMKLSEAKNKKSESIMASSLFILTKPDQFDFFEDLTDGTE